MSQANPPDIGDLSPGTADMRQGRFREDLYFRLCSDVITTPPLREQVQESPKVMRELVRYMANRVPHLCG